MNGLQQNAEKLKDQCVALLCDNPEVDFRMLEKASGGKIGNGEGEVTGKEHAKVIVNTIKWMIESSSATDAPKQRRARKSSASADEPQANLPLSGKKRRGRPPKAETLAKRAAQEAAKKEAAKKEAQAMENASPPKEASIPPQEHQTIEASAASPAETEQVSYDLPPLETDPQKAPDHLEQVS